MNNLTLLYNEISGLAEQVHAVGNSEAFSRYTVQALFDRHEVVSGKLTARNEALQQSLGVEQTKEQLRLQFAEKAATFKAHCDERSAQITALEGDLETRILTIQKLHEEYCSEVYMLEEMQVLSNTLEEWGIINNSHTPETILSLRAVWDVLGKVLIWFSQSCCRCSELDCCLWFLAVPSDVRAHVRSVALPVSGREVRADYARAIPGDHGRHGVLRQGQRQVFE
jgi:hypothetical protein